MSYATMPASGKISYGDIQKVFGGPGSGAVISTFVQYNSYGTYSYVVPCGITSMEAFAVGPGGGGAQGTFQNACCTPCGQPSHPAGYKGGGGGGGGGGAVAYNGSFAVLPRDVVQMQVGKGGDGGTVTKCCTAPCGYSLIGPTSGSGPTTISIISRTGGASLSAAAGTGAAIRGGKGGVSGNGNLPGAVTQVSTSSGGTVHSGSGGGGQAGAGTSNSGSPWARGIGGDGTSRCVGLGKYSGLGKGGQGGSGALKWLPYCTTGWNGGGVPGGGATTKGAIVTNPGSGGNGGGAGFCCYVYALTSATVTFCGYIYKDKIYVTCNTGPDPIIAGTSFCVPTGSANVPQNSLDPATTAYVLIIGDSNAANYGPSNDTYTPTGDVQRLNKNGSWETASSPGNANRLATGYNWGTGSAVAAPGGVSGGNMDGRIGDALIATGLHNAVKIVNVAVRGAKISDWRYSASGYNGGTPIAEDDFPYVTTNTLWQRIQYAVDKSGQDPIFTFKYVFYLGGETDAATWTSYSNYQTYFSNLKTDLRNVGINAPIYITKTSYTLVEGNNVITNSTVTSVQQNIVEAYTDVWPGPNTDTYTNSSRWNLLNYTAAGMSNIARDWGNAISASKVNLTSVSDFTSGGAAVKVYNFFAISSATSLVSGSGAVGSTSVWQLDNGNSSYYYGAATPVANQGTFTGGYGYYKGTATKIPPGAGSNGTDGLAVLYTSQTPTGSANAPIYCYYRGCKYVADVAANANIPASSQKGIVAIKLCQFYGATGVFCYQYSLAAGTYDQSFNLYSRVSAAGWIGGPINATVTVNGVLGGCATNNLPAFTNGTGWGSWSPTITLTVGTGTGVITGFGGSLNAAGGTAIKLTAPTKIYNYGIIQGGGGSGIGSQYRCDPYGAGGAGYPAGSTAGSYPCYTGGSLFSGGFPSLTSIGVFDYWFVKAHWKTVWRWGGYGGGWENNLSGCTLGGQGSPSTDGWGGGGWIHDHDIGGAPIYAQHAHGGNVPGYAISGYNTYATYSAPGAVGITRGYGGSGTTG